MFDIHLPTLRTQLQAWLLEDVGTGDVTSAATIAIDAQCRGIIHTKESGFIAGLPVATEVFAMVDSSLQFTPMIEEGAFAAKGTIIAKVEGNARAVLAGERLALNLLQRMSGVATNTRAFVAKLEGLPVRLVDTRKTTPGHRMLEKYAVRVGGGHNHRFGLYDAVMIKDNHIKAAGGITAAVHRARAAIPHTMKIEVETENLDQTKEALQAGADIIMLDNMQTSLMREAVQLVKLQAPHIVVEASGGVTLNSIREIAETGVDVISVGGLTHSIRSLDISLDLGDRKGVSV